jgi:hypothetical protein
MTRDVSQAERERRRLADRERWAAAKAEELALQAHFEQLASLEASRGGALRREGRRVRAEGRDGLMSLFERGVIDQAEMGAGLLYRQAFEAMERGPRSHLEQDVIRSTGQGEALAWAERRTHLFRRLKEMEALAADARALWCLRLCAGEGRTLGSMAGGGRRHVECSQAIKGVLGAIAEARGLRRRAA